MAKTKKIPAKPKAQPTQRQDGWENVYTGIGVLGRDKRLGTSYTRDVLDQGTAEELWRGDDIIARIVETSPDEMLREGFEVAIEQGKDLCEEMDHEVRRLNVIETIREALYFARAYGGAGILLGADDGASDLSRPLAEDRIRKFDWLNVLTPRELQPESYYADPRKPKYGEISVYRLVPVDAPLGARITDMPLVHESRILRFDGVRTSRGARLRNVHPGWDDSVLVRCAQIVADFQAAWQGTAIIMQDFAPPTLKIKGLAKILAQQDSNEQTMAKRAAAIELCRSIARTVILDAEEEYKRETVSVQGLPELLDKMMLRLAAAANMPVSLLMGQAPAGLNATGDSDIRWFYDQISAKQERFLRPPLMRILRLLFLNKSGPAKGKEPENWDLRFNPLWQLTEGEQANIRKLQADVDSQYIANQVITPEEVAKSRFGGDAYSTETVIDVELRDELLDDTDGQEERLTKAPEEKAAENAPAGKGETAQKGQPAPSQKFSNLGDDKKG